LASIRKKGSFKMDMCDGPILPQLVTFAMPLIFSNVLQLTFAAADPITVGRFAGEDSLAAVGATVSLISLLTNLFLGVSVGANVVAARDFGAGNREKLSRTVHTTLSLSLIIGLFLNLTGVILAPMLLRLMNTPESILPLSTLYLRIYFFCMIPLCIYNFGSAILRAVGDTRRPMAYLAIGGIINVGINLFTVIVLQMGVAGVAMGTLISQTIAATLVVRCLMREEEGIRLEFAKLRIDAASCKQVLMVGIPAGLQSTMYSISNVVIQSAINSFGEETVAACTAAVNLEDMLYFALNAIMQSVTSFTGQNMGPGKFDRIRRVQFVGHGFVAAVGIAMGGFMLIFAEPLISIFTTSDAVTALGVERLRIVLPFYFICGLMEIFVAGLRGMGSSVLPTAVSVGFVCGLRLIWLLGIFPALPSPSRTMIYVIYPITWIVTGIAEGICFLYVYRKKSRQSMTRADI